MIDVIGLIQTLESEEEREYFTKLYDEYAARVKKAVKRYIYNDSDADDVVGLIFVKIIEDKDSFANTDDVMAARIVFRKTKSICINIIRKKKLSCMSISDIVEDEEGNIEDLEIPDDIDIPGELVNAESVQKLQEAIKKLPLEHQDIIKLKFEEELTNVQIAGILGMNASTVGTILNRSMTKLRKILEEYYHD
ncbi:MAG: sigma-70 family RNA polymerase sigma factor [Clostridia bacterium]|nr:sigma-70 family RNA polymerase sigma factor [Clostridia bacterium]